MFYCLKNSLVNSAIRGSMIKCIILSHNCSTLSYEFGNCGSTCIKLRVVCYFTDYKTAVLSEPFFVFGKMPCNMYNHMKKYIYTTTSGTVVVFSACVCVCVRLYERIKSQLCTIVLILGYSLLNNVCSRTT